MIIPKECKYYAKRGRCGYRDKYAHTRCYGGIQCHITRKPDADCIFYKKQPTTPRGARLNNRNKEEK